MNKRREREGEGERGDSKTLFYKDWRERERFYKDWRGREWETETDRNRETQRATERQRHTERQTETQSDSTRVRATNSVQTRRIEELAGCMTGMAWHCCFPFSKKQVKRLHKARSPQPRRRTENSSSAIYDGKSIRGLWMEAASVSLTTSRRSLWSMVTSPNKPAPKHHNSPVHECV